MEESPLTKAHEHARAASNATRQSESTVAINEHALAAGEFANAAKNTTSVDALRTLGLLENYHRRLAELLNTPRDRKPAPPTADADAEDKEAAPALEHIKQAGEHKTAQAAAPPTQQKRIASRSMTSSIASNLASARGIKARNRGDPVPPSVTNDQAPGNFEVSPRKETSGSRSKMHNVLEHSNRPGWVPPDGHRKKELEALDEEDEAAVPARTTATSANDDNYSRFSYTFGGLFNKLSAPLAFAGLPLVAEDPPEQKKPVEPSRSMSPAVKRTRHKSTPSAAEPDLSKIYSRATMRAISGQNPNESFYVVPTSGHTMSYANILNYADKEKRRMEASLHVGGDAGLDDDEEDFVDARESHSNPPSPSVRRRPGAPSSTSGSRSRGGGGGPGSKTVEELAMENKSLKEVLDKLSKRLHTFEASAQNSHLALAESMRFRRPGSPLHSSGASGGGGPDAASALQAKNRELEDRMTAALRRIEALEGENAKSERALQKYRDRWDQLKAGAKARRSAQGGGGEGPGQEGEDGGGAAK